MKARRLGEHWLEIEGGYSGRELEILYGGDCTALHGSRGALRRLVAGAQSQDTRPWALPVYLDGPDLEDVLARTGLRLQEFIDDLQSAPLKVAFLGFLPGFAYIDGLPPHLHLPRRDVPRKRVPAGSLAIAGGYIGVYPSDSPGGWHLIGRSDAVLFDPGCWPPTELTPGRPISVKVC